MKRLRGQARDEVLTSNSASSLQVASIARLEVDSNGTGVTRPHDWDGVADGNTLVVAVGELKGGASSDDRCCEGGSDESQSGSGDA